MSIKVGPNLPATVIQAGQQISNDAINALASADTPATNNPFVTVSYFNSHGGGGGGGGASWGSISGNIANQTDLQNQFAGYLPISGGAMSGGLSLGGDMNGNGYNITDCNISISAGQITAQNVTLTYADGGVLTFSDGSVQSTSATTFNGGSIGNPITYGNMTTDSYFGADLIGVELTGTGQNTLIQYNSLSSTNGTQYSYFTPTSIASYDGNGYSQLSPYFFYTSNGYGGEMYYTPTYIQFADGTTQTSAPSAGLDAIGAFYAGVCSNLYSAFYSWNYYASPMQFILNSYWQSNNGYPPYGSGGTPNVLTSGNIGLTQDGVNFYPFDNYYLGTLTSSSYTGTSSPVYLGFKDGLGNWHTCPINFN